MFVQGREMVNGSKFFSSVTSKDLTIFFSKIFILTKKSSKTWFLGQKWWKNCKVKKIWSKFFLVGIESERFETYLKQKSRYQNFFPCKIFFVWLSRFLATMTKIAKNDIGKKFRSKIFFVRIDSECFETYFKRKSRNRKFFSI